MRYSESNKLWLGNPNDYDFKIEYLMFKEGGYSPEVMQKTHMLHTRRMMIPYLEDADEVIFGPVDAGP